MRVFLSITALLVLFWLQGCAHGGAPRTEAGESLLPPFELAAGSDYSQRRNDPLLLASLEGTVPADPSAPASSGSGPSVPAVNEPLEEEPQFEEQPPPILVWDPLEGFNRLMFKFNDKLYFLVLKPVARGYAAVVPQWGRERVSSFFDHLTMPANIVNSLLQLKIRTALVDLSRFILNTTMGVGGLFDIASESVGLQSSEEDLGQTFGRYGMGHGIYLVLPFIGPSSARDAVGILGDSFLYPVYYLDDTATIVGVLAYDRVNLTSLRLGEYEDFKAAAFDPYVAMRDAYLQHRKAQVEK